VQQEQVPANLLRPTSSERRCSLALLVHKYLLTGTKVHILTPEELPSKTAERGSGKGGGGEGGSGSNRRQTPSNSLATSLPGDSLHAHIAQVEAKGRSEDTLLSPDSFSVLEPSGLPPAFPRPPLPNALLAQQQPKQPQKQAQAQTQAAAEAAAAKRAEEARLKRVEAEAGALSTPDDGRLISSTRRFCMLVFLAMYSVSLACFLCVWVGGLSFQVSKVEISFANHPHVRANTLLRAVFFLTHTHSACREGAPAQKRKRKRKRGAPAAAAAAPTGTRSAAAAAGAAPAGAAAAAAAAGQNTGVQDTGVLCAVSCACNYVALAITLRAVPCACIYAALHIYYHECVLVCYHIFVFVNYQTAAAHADPSNRGFPHVYCYICALIHSS
jgi:hypothetical protein